VNMLGKVLSSSAACAFPVVAD